MRLAILKKVPQLKSVGGTRKFQSQIGIARPALFQIKPKPTKFIIFVNPEGESSWEINLAQSRPLRH